jgi:hypothetical protein
MFAKKSFFAKKFDFVVVILLYRVVEKSQKLRLTVNETITNFLET